MKGIGFEPWTGMVSCPQRFGEILSEISYLKTGEYNLPATGNLFFQPCSLLKEPTIQG
jgi:hypothetical protein